mmetsp:Transcript_63456/g.105788  ORF Transcript_63456/g.105788 Transcript_63456/m.105788 type:complete len:92 (+) Transcript_63456:910-1185(+)
MLSARQQGPQMPSNEQQLARAARRQTGAPSAPENCTLASQKIWDRCAARMSRSRVPQRSGNQAAPLGPAGRAHAARRREEPTTRSFRMRRE